MARSTSQSYATAQPTIVEPVVAKHPRRSNVTLILGPGRVVPGDPLRSKLAHAAPNPRARDWFAQGGPGRGLTLFRSLLTMRCVARKRSHETKLLLQMLLDAPMDETYGLEVVRATGLAAGSAYVILRRLEDEGLLDSRWEELDSSDAGRPPRRYYRLNGEGRRVAQRETAPQRRALRSLAPGWTAA
jgi:PadR family transcriptional regulator, regulatory protein PadR